MIKTVIKLAAATGISLGFMGSAALASSITNTGPHSFNAVNNTSISWCNQNSVNNAGALNFNGQWASTGNATVKHNTNGGSATSGDATNNNSTVTGISATNSGGACGWSDPSEQGGSISNTGPHSFNAVNNFSVNGSNTNSVNNVGVANVSLQGASTGNATVKGNTNGGSAMSGNATNNNSTVTSIVVSNN